MRFIIAGQLTGVALVKILKVVKVVRLEIVVI